MAKKAVATFRAGKSQSFTKVIVPVKNAKTGAYSFKEEIILSDEVAEHLKNLKK